MIILRTILWGLLAAAPHIILALYVRPFTVKFDRRARAMDGHFFHSLGYAFRAAPFVLGTFGAINLIIVVAALAFPALGWLVTLGLFVTPPLMFAGFYLFFRVLVGDPDAVKTRDQTAVVWGSIIVVTAVFAAAAWSGITAVPAAPFSYEDVWLIETDYCPGDNLVVAFSGSSDGSGRDYIISGFVTNEEIGTRHFYDEVFVPGNDSPAAFFENTEYTDRTLPTDLPPGQYTYTHANRSGDGSDSDSFTTEPFTVQDCP